MPSGSSVRSSWDRSLKPSFLSPSKSYTRNASLYLRGAAMRRVSGGPMSGARGGPGEGGERFYLVSADALGANGESTRTKSRKLSSMLSPPLSKSLLSSEEGPAPSAAASSAFLLAALFL